MLIYSSSTCQLTDSNNFFINEKDEWTNRAVCKRNSYDRQKFNYCRGFIEREIDGN